MKEENPKKNKGMIRRGLMRTLSAIAAILILFGVGFTSVSVVLDDRSFVEEQYTALGTDDEMGIPIPDLSKATSALFDYMRDRRENIRVSVIENGVQIDDLFYHEKEIIHMEEVRTLWRNLTLLSTGGLLIAAGLLVLVVLLGERNARLRSVGAGLITGTAIFTAFILLGGLWAISDFNSFWTAFHFIIFPDSLVTYLSGGMSVEVYNSLNWVFEPDFAMIRMLDELFLPLVLRVGIFFAVEIALLLIIAVFVYLRGRKLEQSDSALVEETIVETRDPFETIEDAPDLVLQHKLQNASLKQKKKLMEELRKVPGEADDSEPEPWGADSDEKWKENAEPERQPEAEPEPEPEPEDSDEQWRPDPSEQEADEAPGPEEENELF